MIFINTEKAESVIKGLNSLRLTDFAFLFNTDHLILPSSISTPEHLKIKQVFKIKKP